MAELWAFRDEAAGDIDLVGFTVHAVDGKTGKVDEASHDVGSCCIVVDTGGLRGHKVLLPAGIVGAIDPESESVHVDVSKSEVKEAPEYDPIGLRDDEYRIRVASHFEGARTGGEARM
jgi:hypothetical protein